MMRLAGLSVLLALLSASASAGAEGTASIPVERGRLTISGTLSRAQVAQIIADRGYFEMDGLRQETGGTWHCTALSAPGKRVTLTVDPYGNIAEESPMHAAGQ